MRCPRRAEPTIQRSAAAQPCFQRSAAAKRRIAVPLPTLQCVRRLAVASRSVRTDALPPRPPCAAQPLTDSVSRIASAEHRWAKPIRREPKRGQAYPPPSARRFAELRFAAAMRSNRCDALAQRCSPCICLRHAHRGVPWLSRRRVHQCGARQSELCLATASRTLPCRRVASRVAAMHPRRCRPLWRQPRFASPSRVRAERSLLAPCPAGPVLASPPRVPQPCLAVSWPCIVNPCVASLARRPVRIVFSVMAVSLCCCCATCNNIAQQRVFAGKHGFLG